MYVGRGGLSQNNEVWTLYPGAIQLEIPCM